MIPNSRIIGEDEFRAALRASVRAGLAAAERAFEEKSKRLGVRPEVVLGQLEKLSCLQLRELKNDCIAEEELRRHAEIKKLTAGYDPLASQITRRP